MLSFGADQFQQQAHIYFLPAPGLSARVIILGSHICQPAKPGYFYLRLARDRLVRRPPACFFLKLSKLWFSSSHATARNAFSKASSIWVSASASFACRNWLRSRVSSFTSSALSTRMILPCRPLPNCRTHRITVSGALIPYLRCTS